MWPFGPSIKQLQQACIDDIVAEAEKRGIVFKKFYPRLKAEKYDYDFFKDGHLERLFLLKKRKQPYSLDFWVEINSWPAVSDHPAGAVKVGNINNPNYTSQFSQYLQYLTARDSIRATITDEMGSWNVNGNRFKGPNNKSWAEEQSFWKEAIEKYTCNLANWEKLTAEELSQLSRREELPCLDCRGKGYTRKEIWTPSPFGYGGSSEVVQENCNACMWGSGKRFYTPEEMKKYLKPQKPELIYCSISESEINAEAQRRKISLKIPPEPKKENSVYLIVIPK